MFDVLGEMFLELTAAAARAKVILAVLALALVALVVAFLVVAI